MLASIKNKTKGWVAYLIVGIITIPFALFGIHDYVNNVNDATIASVNGEEITGAEYFNQLNNLVRNAQEQLGDNYTPEIENSLRRQAINGLVDRKILENLANELEFATTNDEIKQEILTNQAFFNDGKFDLETYNSILAINGLTPKRYEEDLLQLKTITQLRDNLFGSNFLSVKQLAILDELTNEQRNTSYSQINIDDFNTDEQMKDITDAKVALYYEANKSGFMRPETLTIDYITLDTSNVQSSIQVSEEEIIEQYEIEKERYQTEEERNASHILVEESALADEIKTKLDNGADFSELAKEFSIDTSNAENGGSLGFFTKGVMVPEFEEMVFAMNTGEISTPVRTDFGYHIIKLNNISEGRTKPLEDLRAELINSIQQSKAQLEMLELSEQLQNTVYEQGIEIAAEDLDLTLTTSEPLTRDSNKLPPIVVNTAFSEEVLSTNEALVVEVDENTAIALRKNTLSPSKPKSLEEARDEIVTTLRAERARDLANAFATTLVDEKKDLETTVGWTYRESSTPQNATAINAAFATPKSEQYSTQIIGNTILVTKVDGIRIQERDAPVDYSVLDEHYSEQLFNDITKHIKATSDIKVLELPGL